MGIPSDAKGAITSGIAPNTYIDRTIAFILEQLPVWRDHPDRAHDSAEESLNSQLCKFLVGRAKLTDQSLIFHHEERQGKRRRVDLSVSPLEPIIVGAYRYSIFEPFLVIEGKRLPAPTAAREREYVTGRETGPGMIGRTGGIQRFKLRLHGHAHEMAVMIGYVQERTLASWVTTINGWIGDLAGKTTADGCTWLADEQLANFQEDVARGTSICFSRHARIGDPPGDIIKLYHLWVLMIAK